MITEEMIPMIVVPLSFLFVLLIILISKAPKVGAWLVGALVLTFPVFVWVFARAGAFRHEEAVPAVVLPAAFLFVLVMILLAKAPKAGVGLVTALVVMGVVSVFLFAAASHRGSSHVAQVSSYGSGPLVVVEQQTWDGAGNRAAENSVQPLLVPIEPVSPTPPAISPIWSEGLEREFDADIYPSKLAAVQAAGRRMDKSVGELIGDSNAPSRITVFQEASDPELIAGLRDAIQQAMPQTTCTVETYLRNLQPNEVGITMQFSGMTPQPAPWASASETRFADGVVHVHVFTMKGRVIPQRRFIEMPWVENFSAFAGARPNQHYIVARSNETCTSEGEAHQQALNDARARLTEALGAQAKRRFAELSAPAITSTDVLQGGFVVDQFAQSFAGSAGRIWRQALLIDVSGPTLAKLADQKAREMRSERMSWARMGLSAIGVVVLIGAIYFFLNMATMGYYEWSLRIAGIVLAMVAVLSILMIVR
jgi:hypothetical protein